MLNFHQALLPVDMFKVEFLINCSIDRIFSHESTFSILHISKSRSNKIFSYFRFSSIASSNHLHLMVLTKNPLFASFFFSFENGVSIHFRPFSFSHSYY